MYLQEAWWKPQAPARFGNRRSDNEYDLFYGIQIAQYTTESDDRTDSKYWPAPIMCGMQATMVVVGVVMVGVSAP